MKRLTPSMLVAMVALFVALSGVAVAGSGFISGRQIANHTIEASKLTPSALTFLKGRQGPAGPAGTVGAAKLDQGLGPVAYQCAFGGGGCQVGSSTATCPTGVAVGGGYVTGTVNDDVASAHVAGTSSYTVIANNNFGSPSWVQAYVICEEGGTYNSIVPGG